MQPEQRLHTRRVRGARQNGIDEGSNVQIFGGRFKNARVKHEDGEGGGAGNRVCETPQDAARSIKLACKQRSGRRDKTLWAGDWSGRTQDSGAKTCLDSQNVSASNVVSEGHTGIRTCVGTVAARSAEARGRHGLGACP
eukprot:6211839-Pleurochrysis_carterae.AAC.1